MINESPIVGDIRELDFSAVGYVRSSVVKKMYVHFDAGDGKIVLKEDEHSETNGDINGVDVKKLKKRNPVDIELDVVLGKMPRKV